MSFIEQTAKIFSSVAEPKFQAALFGRDAFYLEGCRPMLIDGNEMIFRAGGEVIRVVGENMRIKELDGDCVSIIGRINGFTVGDV